MNPYLKAQREKYDALRSSIEGLQTRAASEKRDLTADELRSVTEQAASAKSLAETIESLTDVETRNAKVAALAVNVAADVVEESVKNRASTTVATRVGATTAVDRDPGHYRADGEHSFFADLTRSKHGDDNASRRIVEHNRALSTGSNGPGIVPPHWLVEEMELVARMGRPLANAVRNIPLGDDPRPITLPKQTVGTDATVLEQSAENDATSATDLYDTDVDTVTMKPTAGIQIVSRQMLDMSSPAVDMLIYGDMLAAYNLKVEKKVGAALVTASGSAVKTYATEAAYAAGTISDDLVDAAIAVRNQRKLPADILALSVNRYGSLLKLKDDAGRPLIPLESNGPMNVLGVGSVAVDGRIHGLGVIPTDGINDGATYPESIVVLRASDTILFESNVLQFRYEQPLGPESVKLGVWGYTGVIVRQNGKSSKRIIVTAA